jgi:low affinity Fe/Cu permease
METTDLTATHLATQAALMGQKLDQLLLAVSDVRATFIDIEERVRALENDSARMDERIKTGDQRAQLTAVATGITAAVIGVIK